MAESSAAAAERQLMPGAFDQRDYIEFHEDPWVDAVEDVADEVELGRESKARVGFWTTHQLPEIAGNASSWYQYDPPPALRDTPSDTSDVLKDLIEASIATIAAQASEEEVRMRQQEEERRRSSEPVRKSDDELYLPIIIRPERPPSPPPSPSPAPSPAPESDVRSPSSFDSTAPMRAEAVLSVSKSKSPGKKTSGRGPEKTRKLTLRRILGQKDDEAATLSGSVARGSFGRKLLGASSSGAGVMSTQDVMGAMPQPTQRQVMNKAEEPPEMT